MATLDQLFGKRDFGEKRPSAPKWSKVGDYFDAVVTGEPEVAPQLDVNQTWKPKYLEKQDDGAWKPRVEHELTKDKDSQDVIALTQIILPVHILDGSDKDFIDKDATFYFDNKAKRDALEAAMSGDEDEGIPQVALEVGVGIRYERVKQTDKKTNAFAWSVTLIAPEDESE